MAESETRQATLQRILNWLVVLLIVTVTVRIVAQYVDYVPLQSRSDFVADHDAAFRRLDYRVAFYSHIIVSPICLLNGLILLNDSIRHRRKGLHRVLGRIQVGLILAVLVPSGMRMAMDAFAGWPAGVSFALLSAGLATCTVMGFLAAVKGRIQSHCRWMRRVMILLSSAIALRLISAGLSLFPFEDAESGYVAAAWLSWLVPLFIHELVDRRLASLNSSA